MEDRTVERQFVSISQTISLKSETVEELRAWLDAKVDKQRPAALLWLAGYIGGELGLQTALPPELEEAYAMMILNTIVDARKLYREHAKGKP